MSAGFSNDSTPAATFSRRHPQVTEIAPRDPRADHLKSRTDDRCISPTALPRFSCPGAFALAQKHMRGKACGPKNQEARDVGEEISLTAQASPCCRVSRSTDHAHAAAQERVHRQSTNRAAQPAPRPQCCAVDCDKPFR